MARCHGLAEIRALFADRGETLADLDGGFRLYRRFDDGRTLFVNVRLIVEHRVLLFTMSPPAASVPAERRPAVAIALNEINAALAHGAFVMKDYVNFRTHAYLDGDGGIDVQVLLDSVDFVQGVARLHADALCAAIGEPEFEVEPEPEPGPTS